MARHISFDQPVMEVERLNKSQRLNDLNNGWNLTFIGSKFVELVSNCSDHYHFETLLKLMHIFQQSLPNMKINQIHSYVFSSQNEKLLLLRDGQLQGGLCFKTIPKRYVQIELLAIPKQKRNKGYGSLLMAAFKHLLQLRKINLSVTNADNNSLQFYYKHGFSEQQYIPNHIWSNHYQQFSYSTKLQCLIMPTINYFILRQKLKQQKAFVENQLRKYYLVNEQPYQVTIPSQRSLYTRIQGREEEYFLIDPLQIPGVVESGWTWNEYNKQKEMKQTKNYRSYGKIFNRIYQKAQPQLKKIAEQIKKSDLIERIEPNDLSCIFEKIKKQEYQSAQMFFYQLEEFFNQAADFYRANPKIIFNLIELRQILEAQKAMLLTAELKAINVVKL